MGAVVVGGLVVEAVVAGGLVIGAVVAGGLVVGAAVVGAAVVGAAVVGAAIVGATVGTPHGNSKALQRLLPSVEVQIPKLQVAGRPFKR